MTDRALLDFQQTLRERFQKIDKDYNDINRRLWDTYADAVDLLEDVNGMRRLFDFPILSEIEFESLQIVIDVFKRITEEND